MPNEVIYAGLDKPRQPFHGSRDGANAAVAVPQAKVADSKLSK